MVTLYHQAVHLQIRQPRIESGDLEPGDRISSVVSLAQEYELAAGTVRKAISALQQEGLIVSRVGGNVRGRAVNQMVSSGCLTAEAHMEAAAAGDCRATA